jgi:flagellar FliL protein
MSAAAIDASAPPKKRLSKKLIVIIAAVVLLLVIAGGATVLLLKKKAADAAAAEDEDGATTEVVVHERPKTPPVYVPLEAFTVNLSDRNAERFAQIGITLELADAKLGDEIKAYMPAVRNALLMVLAHKTSVELLERSGKEKLAVEIQRETLRAMQYPVEDAAPASPPDGTADAATPPTKRKPTPAAESPIRQVHFSSFIIQ